MAYVKFHYSTTECGRLTLARLFSGSSLEEAEYSGTLVMTTEIFQQLSHRLLEGSSHLLEVDFGPDYEGAYDHEGVRCESGNGPE
jgi:hypothetical protein